MSKNIIIMLIFILNSMIGCIASEMLNQDEGYNFKSKFLPELLDTETNLSEEEKEKCKEKASSICAEANNRFLSGVTDFTDLQKEFNELVTSIVASMK